MTRPGLQPQRTSLAWSRTALASLGLVGVVVKVAADGPNVRTVVCAAVVIANTVVVTACAAARGRTVSAAPPARLFATAYAGTVVAGLAASVSIVESW